MVPRSFCLPRRAPFLRRQSVDAVCPVDPRDDDVGEFPVAADRLLLLLQKAERIVRIVRLGKIGDGFVKRNEDVPHLLRRGVSGFRAPLECTDVLVRVLSVSFFAHSPGELSEDADGGDQVLHRFLFFWPGIRHHLSVKGRGSIRAVLQEPLFVGYVPETLLPAGIHHG